MSHGHPGRGKRGFVAAQRAGDCPSRESLSLLVQGLLPGRDREILEGHVAACEVCAFELTRLVDERQALDRTRRHRRFPWVPVIAASTVLAACAIAWLLSGGGKYIELTEAGRLLSFTGNLELGRGKSGPTLKPVICLALNRGDRVRTPDPGAQAHFISHTGRLYRYDSRGETMLARLGSRVAIPGREKRQAELHEIAADAPAEPGPASGLRPRAPRGNILTQKPSFELSGPVPEEPIHLEIREEEPRIRIRWSAKGTRIAFPANGRPLERGRTFFWKAADMQEEQAFFIASDYEYEEWGAFRETLAATGIPEVASLILEERYLLTGGFHLDALRRVEEVCRRCRDAVWVQEEAALVLDRLGRTDQARERLARARDTRRAHR